MDYDAIPTLKYDRSGLALIAENFKDALGNADLFKKYAKGINNDGRIMKQIIEASAWRSGEVVLERTSEQTLSDLKKSFDTGFKDEVEYNFLAVASLKMMQDNKGDVLRFLSEGTDTDLVINLKDIGADEPESAFSEGLKKGTLVRDYMRFSQEEIIPVQKMMKHPDAAFAYMPHDYPLMVQGMSIVRELIV